jgi:hypothetical protein
MNVYEAAVGTVPDIVALNQAKAAAGEDVQQ